MLIESVSIPSGRNSFHIVSRAPTTTGRYRNLDDPALTKRSFLLGSSLFVVGALGEAAIHSAGMPLPAWEETLLLVIEFLGVFVMLRSPFVFGVFLPLTE